MFFLLALNTILNNNLRAIIRLPVHVDAKFKYIFEKFFYIQSLCSFKHALFWIQNFISVSSHA